LRIGGKPVDVRVSTLPTGHGERAVLRLLDKEAGRLDLKELGMSEPTLHAFDHLINQPHGIVLVTGPTGSGKSTTLYAALSRLNATTTNILTVEDPIEYELVRRRPDASQSAHRHDVRQSAACDSAAGPGRHHDRRNPRSGNRADRGAGIADRPSGIGNVAYQRFGGGCNAFARHGHRTISAVVVAARRRRATVDSDVVFRIANATTDTNGMQSAASIARKPVITVASAFMKSCRRRTHSRADSSARIRRRYAYRRAADGMRTMREDGERWVATV
jgi:energy-coupling factor transporter ATP-binding protein EcfA2